MKVSVSSSVTMNVGGRNFIKQGYSIEDEVQKGETLDQARKRLSDKTEEWLQRDVDECIKRVADKASTFGG